MMKDTVVLIKPDGTRVEGIRASVQSEKIMVDDDSLPIEEGDTIERERPSGIVERYMVLDAGYHADFHGIPAHFSMQVRKETAIPRNPPSPSNNYYLTGPNSRVNNNSLDASVNVSLTQQATLQLFDDLLAALNEVADVEQREQLIVDVEEMKATQGSPRFLARYQQFMQDAANHMTVVTPFLPALAQLLT
jgi:hypothetical protein